MISATIECLDLLSDSPHKEIVEWACPVPFFGDPSRARVATVGLNPSNKEFVDDALDPLTGSQQRLPTIASLGLERWADAGSREVRRIDDACRRYFDGNAYSRWFDVLEELVRGLGTTFYGLSASACHLDLIPFATERKWGELTLAARRALTQECSGLFARVLADSDVSALILNGRSVVETFEIEGGLRLEQTIRPDWSLPRATIPVTGIAYSGSIDCFDGYDLGRSVRVLGYNHNLQSSYGVTSAVKAAIRNWLIEELGE